MCAYTAYVAQLSTEVCRPRSPKCNPPLGRSAVLWRQTEGGTLGKAPRHLRKSAHVRYHFGGFPPYTSSEENISSPFRKLLIHSISVKWFADLGGGGEFVFYLSFRCVQEHSNCGKGRSMYGLAIDEEDAELILAFYKPVNVT